MAKTDFDDIIPFCKDRFLVRALDLSRKKAPSSPTIQQRLDAGVADVHCGPAADRFEAFQTWILSAL